MDESLAKSLSGLGLQVYQGYGLTETSPVIAVENDHAIKSGTVGKVLPSLELKIENKNEMGIGEIVVKGPSVMLGYYKNNSATEEVFEGEWFHTGDLGYVEDGFLYITGRKKNVIVQKNGKNIYPEELEILISHIPGVKESMIYGKPTQDGDLDVCVKIVYDKDIGIKVDNIIMDESKLDISYLYKVNNNIDKFELYEYTIKDIDNYIWYKFNNGDYIYESPPIITGMHNSTNPVRLENNIIRESILYSSNEFPKCEKLFIEVNKIRLNSQEIIEGNWKIELNIADKFNEREKIIYEPSYNEHIIQSEIYLTETTLKVSLELDVLYDDDFLLYNPVSLKDKFDKIYKTGGDSSIKLEKTSRFNFEFNVSKYDENIDILYLAIPINDDTTIVLQLNKK